MTTVVIAEDEAIIRLDLRETLVDEGYDVIGETGRGDEAVNLVRNLHPDLVILDIKMPGMDGLETAELIRARRKSAHTSPIFATRAGVFRSVKVAGPTLPLSTSCHVHGADTGAPRLARTVYAAANVAPCMLRPVST